MTFYTMSKMLHKDYGTRVKIVRQSKYKTYDLIGREGTIRTHYGNDVGVYVDGAYNINSSHGYFYLEPGDFVYVDEFTDINIMEENTMPKITNYHNAVKIRFLDDTYTCKYIYANFDVCVEVGDLVVVKPEHHDITLARVAEILDQKDLELTREVVCKVFMDDYDNRVKVRKQAAEIKAKMQERAKQLQDIALYQMLAKDDPAMMDLLNEYQALPKM